MIPLPKNFSQNIYRFSLPLNLVQNCSDKLEIQNKGLLVLEKLGKPNLIFRILAGLTPINSTRREFYQRNYEKLLGDRVVDGKVFVAV